MKKNGNNTMKMAWDAAREYAKKFGGKATEYFRYALQMAWKDVKSSMGRLRKSTEQLESRRKVISPEARTLKRIIRRERGMERKEAEKKARAEAEKKAKTDGKKKSASKPKTPKKGKSKYKSQSTYKPKHTAEERKAENFKRIIEYGTIVNDIVDEINDFNNKIDILYDKLPLMIKQRVPLPYQIGKHSFDVETFYTGDYEELVADTTEYLVKMVNAVVDMINKIYEVTDNLSDKDIEFIEKDSKYRSFTDFINQVNSVVKDMEMVVRELKQKNIVSDYWPSIGTYQPKFMSSAELKAGLERLGFDTTGL